MLESSDPIRRSRHAEMAELAHDLPAAPVSEHGCNDTGLAASVSFHTGIASATTPSTTPADLVIDIRGELHPGEDVVVVSPSAHPALDCASA